MKKDGKTPADVQRFLARQLGKVAEDGGKARWVGVSPEDRKKMMEAASKKGVEAKRKKREQKQRDEESKQKE